MVKIYINTSMPTEELTEENFYSSFEEYAAKLEKLAKHFKTFSKFIKTNKISVFNIDGFANTGNFEVDNIDAERLKKAGLVFDASEVQAEPDIPAFCIDSKLDEIIEITRKSFDEGSIPAQINIDIAEMPEILEQTMTFNLVDELDIDAELDDGLVPGHMVLHVYQNPEDETHKYNHLVVLDFYSDPAEFRLDRENMIFSYKEKDEEEWKEKPLKEVFSSLRTTNALLSNIVVMVRNNPHLFETLSSLDQDLRFLQQLLVFDYALDDDDDDETDPRKEGHQ